LPDDVPRDPGASSADGAADRESSEEEPRADALEAAIARLAEIAGSLQQLLDVQVARARVEAREKAFRALGWVLVSALLLALTVIAGLYLLRGLSGLLTGLLWNVSWAGDLAAGAAGLLLALAIGLLLRARGRRRSLRRVREKFNGSPATQPEAE
jgi:hypothetical protein